MKKAYFITGTDTNVGKTLVACALLHKFVESGVHAVGMKPVAAGVDVEVNAEDPTTRESNNEDVRLLRASSNVTVAPELDNPFLLQEAMAPHIAAHREGKQIDIEHIAACFDQLRAQADVVIIEGAGGFLVPLNDTQDSGDLAVRLGTPVILVVGMRLGCLNHALLSQEAILARGLRLAGWVANHIDPTMIGVKENVETLKQRMKAPMLGFIPYQSGSDEESSEDMPDIPTLLSLP